MLNVDSCQYQSIEQSTFKLAFNKLSYDNIPEHNDETVKTIES